VSIEVRPVSFLNRRYRALLAFFESQKNKGCLGLLKMSLSGLEKVMPTLNTTTVGRAPWIPLSGPDKPANTRLSRTVMRAESSPEILRHPNVDVITIASEKNAEIPTPQLVKFYFGSPGKFENQQDFETQWESTKQFLKVGKLKPDEILGILSSGILQTETGKALRELLEAAFIRSVKFRGGLSKARLKTITRALFELSPDKWQSAIGEQTTFTSDNPDNRVMQFIQNWMDTSNEELRQKIESKQTLSNAQLDAIQKVASTVKRDLRTDNEEALTAWEALKDDWETRSSPESAVEHLEALIKVLEGPSISESRHFREHLTNKLRIVRDQLESGDAGDLLGSERARPSEVIKLEFFNPPEAKPKGKPENSLLENLKSFERHGDFYTNISTTGMPVPTGIAARVLYAFNLADTFGLLRLDSGHISTRPSGAEPSGHAWKNGASDFSKSPLEPGPAQPEADTTMDALPRLELFATQVDELLNKFFHTVVPWDSAHANDVIEMKTLLEKYADTPYQTTTTGLPSDSPTRYLESMGVVREQMASWLSRMAGSLGTGAAILSRAGDLVENNLGKTVALSAIYVAVSNFYAHWFLPEPEEAVDPLRGIDIHPDPAPDEDAVAHEYAVEGVEDLFDLFPEFENEVKELIRNTAYEVPTDDPQLIENLEELLRQPVPGHTHLTYGDYLDEITVGAALDAHQEFEADAVSELKVKPTVTAEARMFMADNPAHIIKTRSVDELFGILQDIQTSESGVAVHSYAQLLIHAGQRSADAEISIGPGEQIAPGVTISQAADLYINDFVEMQVVLDSSLFIKSEVEKLIADSDLSEYEKKTTNLKSSFSVDYVTEKPNGKGTDYFPKTIRNERFTLAELVTGQHKRKKRSGERSPTVNWPRDYPTSFKDAVDNSDLAGDHKKRLDKFLANPRSFELWKQTFKIKLERQVSNYRESPTISEQAKDVVDGFLKGEVRLRPMAIAHGRFSPKFDVSNAVFLSKQWKCEGLFVFLGGNETIIESPAELFKKGGKSMQDFPELSNELSNRITLDGLLGRDDDDFKDNQGRDDYPWLPFSYFLKSSKSPYDPIIFGRRDGPNRYGENHDAFKDLFDNAVNKVKSDMDTSTSTEAERFFDKLLEILTDTLTLYAIMLGFPGAPTAGLAFLLGAGASALNYTRGKISDDPLEGNRLKAKALAGLVTQTAARYIGQALGKTFNAADEFRITLKVYQLLKLSNSLPKEITDFLPEYGHHSTPLELSVKHVQKWIAPRVRNPVLIQEKLTRKFTSKGVADRLRSLSKKGPEVAQKLMNRSRVLYFSGQKEGYVYRGFTLHGNLKSPEEVFAQGLKSKGPVDNVQGINGMSANNGVDAGVQASGYYDDNGMGAFHQGGKSGGYTYLIDGRAMNGYDVARNRNWKADSGSRTGNNPYQIVYAQDVPGSMILGAYDSGGKFIPNQRALNRAIGKSSPDSSADGIPFPLAPSANANNATQTPLKRQA
jgi:hypothetical protein